MQSEGALGEGPWLELHWEGDSVSSGRERSAEDEADRALEGCN